VRQSLQKRRICHNRDLPTLPVYVKKHFGFDGYGCGLCQTGTQLVLVQSKLEEVVGDIVTQHVDVRTLVLHHVALLSQPLFEDELDRLGSITIIAYFGR
jgi:hypothetical protein